MQSKPIIYGIILFIFAIFIIQNAEIVSIRLFFWDLELPRVLMLIATFVLGTVWGILLPFGSRPNKKK